MTEPSFSPPPQGADQAIRLGRRRRQRRQLGGAAGAAALAAIAAVVALHPFGPPASRDSLRVAADPTASSASGEPDPTTSPQEQSAASASPDSTPSPAGDAAGGEPGGQSGGEPGEPDEPEPDPQSTADDSPGRVSPKPSRSVVAYQQQTACTESLPVTTTGPTWCVFYSGQTTVQRGGEATISVDFCRMPATGSGTWEFSDEDGVSMSISAGDTTVWGSQDGRRVEARPFRISLDAGTCMRFSTTWDTRDRDDFRVRPGEYDAGFGYSGNALGQGASSTGSSGDTIRVTP